MKLNTKVQSTPLYTAEGARAVRLSTEQQLRRSVMSCLLWEDSFYEDGEDIAKRIADLVPLVPAAKVAAIAIEARTGMKLRHAPLFLAREMARHQSHREMVGYTLANIIQRPDELGEFLSIYWKDGKQPLANQVKKGLAQAFQKFDEYALAKYDRDAAVKLNDVLFLCHARPVDQEQRKLWMKLIGGYCKTCWKPLLNHSGKHKAVEAVLETPDTWEVNLSAPGANKRQVWERLIHGGKLGALAVLRNLRNMQDVGVPADVIRLAINGMKTERVLPFRFISAATYAPQFEPELEQAMFRCLEGTPKLKGTTALVVDTSPSMWQAKVSSKSEMTRFDAAAALAILVRQVCEKANVYAFNEKGHVVPARNGFALRDALAKTQAGASRGGLGVELANRDGYDRIIVITDDQWHPMHGEISWQTYSRDHATVCPSPLTDKAYMVDVSVEKHAVGHGRWINISGWSESILGYVQMLEQPAEVEEVRPPKKKTVVSKAKKSKVRLD